MNKKITKVIFPVAGLGTRFLPATKAVPKEMLPIVDRPLIQYAVEEAQAAGCTDFIFVVGGMNRPLLESHFGDLDGLNATLSERGKITELKRVIETTLPSENIHFCTQDEPLGLGHAVWCARDYIDDDESFAVMLPDDLIQATPACLLQMVDVWRIHGGNVVAVEDIPQDMTNRYGILDVIKDEGRVVSACGLVEKPEADKAPSTLSIIGRYILDGRVFEHLDKHLAGVGGEIQLTDAISQTIPDVPFHGLRFDGHRYDCGSMVGFVEANVAFALACPEYEKSVRDRLKRYL